MSYKSHKKNSIKVIYVKYKKDLKVLTEVSLHLWGL